MSFTRRPDTQRISPQALPLFLPAAGWVAGLAVARCDWVNWPVMIGLACAALLLLILQAKRKIKTKAFLGAAFLLAGLGWGWVSLLADARQIAVDDTWHDAAIEFSGEVAGVQQQASYLRLTLTDVQRSDGARLHGRIWLYVYKRYSSDSVNEVADVWPATLAGDRIQVQGRLHVPRNQQNPGGFDFAAYCFDQHIALLGSGEVQRIASGASWLEQVRQRIRYALKRLPSDQGGVIRALLLGEREQIPERIYDAFAATGAAHLLAISGLHIGLVAALGFGLFWFALTRREAWIVNLSVRGIALLGGLLLALAYAQLAGWPLPTQRAAMMLVAAALAWWLRAQAAPMNTLLAALMLILLLDASALGSLSLWLSFVATAGILLWANGPADNEIPAWRRWVIGLFVVTLMAALVTLPLVAHVFGRLPVYSLPANLLMTPLYSLFVLPLSLLAALLATMGLDGGAHILFSLAAAGVESGNRVLLHINQWPGGHIWLPAVPLWLSAAYAGGMGLAALLLGRGLRIPAAGLLLLTLSAYSAAVMAENPPAVTRFTAWDVGQGATSSLLLPDGRVMVIDAAGQPGSRFNAGTTLAAGLRDMGLAHVDVLLISHAQSDHLGGALSLLHHVNRVGELWLADVPQMHLSNRIGVLRRAVLRQGGKVRWLQQGDRVDFSGVEVKVLWPPKDYTSGNSNNSSLLLRLALPGGRGLLLGGDIEASAEASIVDNTTQQELASDVMLMPHHGSRSSSTEAFLAAVHPHLAIAQTGYGNRYGFPAPEVLQRYSRLGTMLRNTADGAVAVDFMPSGTMQMLDISPVMSPKRKLALQWWHLLL